MDLYEKYGHITFPKGYKLYHTRHNEFDSAKYTHLFTSFAGTFYNKSKKIYEITLKQDLKCLFMVSKICHNLCLIGALRDICHNVFGKNYTDDVAIKKEDRRMCMKMIKYFQDNNIFGWFTSWEDGLPTEICLFPENYEVSFDIKEIKRKNVFNHIFKAKTILLAPPTSFQNIDMKHQKKTLIEMINTHHFCKDDYEFIQILWDNEDIVPEYVKLKYSGNKMILVQKINNIVVEQIEG
jgi:hypothetical protein